MNFYFCICLGPLSKNKILGTSALMDNIANGVQYKSITDEINIFLSLGIKLG
jgi:hypothetical protein